MSERSAAWPVIIGSILAGVCGRRERFRNHDWVEKYNEGMCPAGRRTLRPRRARSPKGAVGGVFDRLGFYRSRSMSFESMIGLKNTMKGCVRRDAEHWARDGRAPGKATGLAAFVTG